MTGGAQVTPAADDLLRRYLDELSHWSARINLTSVPPELAWERHVGDTLRLIAAAPPAAAAVCIDVGTGGGVPGIPLAILRPDVTVVLLDSDRRKIGFLTHACGLLGLSNVTAIAARAEDLGHDAGHREHYDLAVSRATAGAAALCELCLPLLRVGGRLAAVLRSAADAARESRAAAIACGGGDPIAAAAEVMIVTKMTPSAGRFPRRAGVPVRRPLR